MHIMHCPTQIDYLYLKNGKLEIEWWYSGHDWGPTISASYGKEICNNYFLVMGLLLCGIGF
jgi:hypothetical protein